MSVLKCIIVNLPMYGLNKSKNLLEKINLAVQINGKTRDIINIKKDSEEQNIYQAIINHSKAKKYIKIKKYLKLFL